MPLPSTVRLEVSRCCVVHLRCGQVHLFRGQLVGNDHLIVPCGTAASCFASSSMVMRALATPVVAACIRCPQAMLRYSATWRTVSTTTTTNNNNNNNNTNTNTTTSDRSCKEEAYGTARNLRASSSHRGHTERPHPRKSDLINEI